MAISIKTIGSPESWRTPSNKLACFFEKLLKKTSEPKLSVSAVPR